jgi:hypothetical protein
MLFDQNFTHFQTMKIRKENFVTIRADCQLCLIFYLILGFYFIINILFILGKLYLTIPSFVLIPQTFKL